MFVKHVILLVFNRYTYYTVKIELIAVYRVLINQVLQHWTSLEPSYNRLFVALCGQRGLIGAVKLMFTIDIKLFSPYITLDELQI
jgi:hypothetical protein